ncbi:aminopeptidase C [Dysgonomonas sp. BGC7]|uniref:aminopeptidase C n=1 Tax=Dysgonomonas sp. BGC7 TaxID=1658008 RepID=UPI000681CA37|nr:C1 family peptidase [Dysgonomonas sp. BGC7]MBD8387573.1 aminopeptidase [Dysgonomonas sp. BGC7]
MRKLLLFSLILIALNISAQNKGYEFETVKENPITSIKNQGSSGTCWSFSGLAFLESELIRTGKGEHDLSAMYIARRNYNDKAQKYVRVGGNINFSQGGSFADVVETLDEYGVIPMNLYTGLNYGESGHKHGELEAGLSGYVKGINENKNRRLSTAWIAGFNGILDAYFGAIPQNFDYKGKSYTPQSLGKSLGLESKNYISLTSYSHHPFYSAFALEIPDNWRWSLSYNLPIDELMQVFDYAINNGYTIAWASDVSEIGFTRNGLAVMPDDEAPENVGSDQAHWLGLSQTERNNKLKAKIEEGPAKEKVITQEMRQIAFDNQETTDDHGMQIYGIAKDQNGSKYYMVKNSWGEAGTYKGLWYASESFVKYKTMSIVIHKDALPSGLAKKLGIK